MVIMIYFLFYVYTALWEYLLIVLYDITNNELGFQIPDHAWVLYLCRLSLLQVSYVHPNCVCLFLHEHSFSTLVNHLNL